jgi:hypothetical protein
LDSLVNVSPIDDGENQILGFDDLEHYPIVSDPQFPVAFQRASKGFAVTFRFRGQRDSIAR